MTTGGKAGDDMSGANPQVQQGFEAALRELQHQALHLEERGAHRAAVTLYDAIRIARAGGLTCSEHASAH